MKKVPAVRQANRPSEIAWPLNMRWPLAIWNVVFAGGAPYAPKADHDPAWNRGAYLVEGLGHCGACHTPRGIAWNEQALDEGGARYLAGANLDNWSAPNLRGDKQAGLGSWSEADLFQFLKTGHNRDGTAFGSMIDVVNNSTPYMDDDDLKAMAAYVKSLPAIGPEPAPYAYDDSTATALRGGHFDRPGATLYMGQCVSCHLETGKGFAPWLPPLAGNPTVLDSDPTSLINIILNASTPLVVKGIPDAYRMPQFRVQLSDRDVAEIVTFIRGAWGNHAGPVTPEQVAAIRKTTDPLSDQVVILKMR
jgi:mono/diheme cytochrome c family protein